MSNIIKSKDIRTAFTQKVKEYLDKGMDISVRTLSGSQGEIAKVDFTDGKYVYRILLHTSYDYLNKDFFYGRLEMVELIVERFEDDGRPELDTWGTLWNGRGEQIENKKYYNIKDREIFTDSLEEIIRIGKVRAERREVKRTNDNIHLNSKRLSFFYNLVKKQKGYSTVTKKQIEKIAKKNYSNGIAYAVYFTKESRKPVTEIKFYTSKKEA